MSNVLISKSSTDLWDLALGQQYIDPQNIQTAIEEEVANSDLDFRTRLLLRDAISALRSVIGEVRVEQWLDKSVQAKRIRFIEGSPLGEVGFPSLVHRIMDSTKSETVKQLLRELGLLVEKPTRLVIGGAIALILIDAISRHTEDINVVDEVPEEIRSRHALLENLSRRYGLHLTHFQSHYLPSGWDRRIQFFGNFGQLQVYLIDPSDIFLGKLFSKREKDRDDLRSMLPAFDKTELTERLKETTSTLQQEPGIREAGERNWYILFGEALPL
ncbi:MAG TPA: DUF6036 family nucleotidyltransferase [Tepidisphaeraceae bacterium]|jgi:hypothetical protein